MRKVLLSVFVAVFAVVSQTARAASGNKPFILASNQPGNIAVITGDVMKKPKDAGFEIAGTYSPYAGVNLIDIPGKDEVVFGVAMNGAKGA